MVILKKELFQQNHDTGEINECGKARKQLVIPCSDMPEIFQLLKEAFYQVPLLVTGVVNFPGFFNIGLRRYAIGSTLRSDVFTDFFGAKGFIAKHRTSVKRNFPK